MKGGRRRGFGSVLQGYKITLADFDESLYKRKTQSYPSFAIRAIAATILVSASRCSATVQ